jgi:site-specific DNA recombinase
MLRRPRNAGLTSYGTENFPASWPAIVPESTWRAVVSILSNPARRTNTTGSSRGQVAGQRPVCVWVSAVRPPLRVSQTGNHRRPSYR